MPENFTAETLDALKKAQLAPIPDAIAKSWTQSASATTGLTYYDLEAPAKTLYPVLTPLRNRIPRVSANGGIQANWKAVTAININNASIGVPQASRGRVIQTTVKDYFAAYRGIGLEDNVDFEADYAAEGYEDVKARAATGLLHSMMLGEEKVLLGGNTSLGLGTTPTPTLTASGSGTSLAAGTISVIAVALAFEGYLAGSVVGGIAGLVSGTGPDGKSYSYGGGSAQRSGNATVAVTAGQQVNASVAMPNGAVAIAWFWGTAGNEVLGAITTINSVVISANATGTQLASAIPTGNQDNSTNGLVFDGILTQVMNPAYGAYNVTLPTGSAGAGTPLTADGQGGIVEIDQVLKYAWDNFRLSFDTIYVSSQEQKNISSKILQGNANSAMRFTFNAEQGALGGGVMVKSYLNKYSMDGATEIPIKLHPNMPAGTILFYSASLPYKLSNVNNVLQVRARRDYYQIEWPLRTRQYEFGIYADEVLQNYFPAAFACIRNIANG